MSDYTDFAPSVSQTKITYTHYVRPGHCETCLGDGHHAFTRGTVKRDNDLNCPRYLSRNHHNT
jgi:hypothetical protein